MMNPSNEEKRSLEDTDRRAGLVDYSSSSEDESPAPLSKKQRNSDSESNTSLNSQGSHNSATEKEHNTKTWEQGPIYYTDSDDDFDEYEWCEVDSEILHLEPRCWRAVDKWNLPEVYQVALKRECPREKSKCFELLDQIGCGDRFRCLSVEMRNVFFADLDRDEAAKMEAAEEVHHVIQHRRCVGDVR